LNRHAGNGLPDIVGDGRDIFQTERAFQINEKIRIFPFKRNLVVGWTIFVLRSCHDNVFPARMKHFDIGNDVFAGVFKPFDRGLSMKIDGVPNGSAAG
jgi:hypothetical protein